MTQRVIKRRNRPRQPESVRAASVRERMATRYTVDAATGCWLWTGRRLQGTYGIIKSSGKNLRAHVVSYELHHGPVPAGLFVCHRCGNAACINPEHLYAGTQSENMHDAAAHGTLAGVSSPPRRCARSSPPLAAACRGRRSPTTMA